MSNPVVVIGGGIAGLSAAISLSVAGNPVLLLEAMEEFTEVGAGLAITANGLAALTCLGLDEAVRDRGYPGRMESYLDRDGSPLMQVPASKLARFVGIHRQALLDLLVQRATELGRVSQFHATSRSRRALRGMSGLARLAVRAAK